MLIFRLELLWEECDLFDHDVVTALNNVLRIN